MYGETQKYIRNYTLRINWRLLAEFRYIANYNGRSVNQEIQWYMRQCVRAFEEEHGKIDLDTD